MIDMLKDERAAAPTLMDKRRVMMEEHTFELLMTRGVTSKVEYDAAPRQPGRFVRNVKVTVTLTSSFIALWGMKDEAVLLFWTLYINVTQRVSGIEFLMYVVNLWIE